MKCHTQSLLLAAIAATGCASWEDTRSDLIEPVNELVHHEYPRSLKAADVGRFVGLYVPEGQAEARLVAEAFLGRWQRVDHVAARIDGLGEVESLDGGGQGVDVAVEFRVDGVAPDGQRATEVAWQTVRCSSATGVWQMVGVSTERQERWAGAGASYTEAAVARGIDYVQESCGLEDELGITRDFVAGTGLAVGDLDHDGLDDVVLVAGRDIRFYRNTGGRFADVTGPWSVAPGLGGEARYGLVADLDGDGLRDVLVGVVEGPSVVYRGGRDPRDGSVVFQQAPAADWGLTLDEITATAVVADFDGDGDLDLYSGNGGNLLTTEPLPVYDAQNVSADQFFRNEGGGRFKDVSAEVGIGWRGWALAASPCDYDQDGDVDLFVANDFGFDRLYRNRGDGTFEDVSGEQDMAYSGSSMGATWGDVDGDGDMDLFVTGMFSNTGWVIDHPDYPVPAPWPLSAIFRGEILKVVKQMFHGNRFYENRGNGTFAEVSSLNGTDNAGWAWGGIFLDYDQDAHLDLYVPNGFLSGELKEDL